MNSKAALAFTLVLGLLSGCSKSEHPVSQSGPQSPLKVQSLTARLETTPALIEIVGTIRPVDRAQIAAKVMGAVEDLRVTLGMPVKKGDLLLRISAGEVSARLLQAQSQLNQARRDLDRERELLSKGASTSDMVKNMEDRFAMTQAMLREAEVMLSYTEIRAPFDGVISRRPVNAGDLASPGMPLLELEGRQDFLVETGIPDSLALSLSNGMSLRVEVPAAGLILTGTLVELSSSAEALARTVPAKIQLPATAGIRSGQFARVKIPGEDTQLLRLPASSVTKIGQLERIFVIDSNNRAHLRLVRTGSQTDGSLSILTGLSEGERVVANPPAGLQDGQLVEVAP